MLISSEMGAGEMVSSRDDTRFYDDIACLATDWPARREGATAFVRTAAGWRDVTTAWFAQPATVRTSMGSGFVAYGSADEAKAADQEARALAWPDVIRLVGERR